MQQVQQKIVPIEIRRLGEHGLQIHWSNSEVQQVSSETLRKNCPSATSKAERGDTSHDKPLSSKKSVLRVVEHTKDEQIRLMQVWAIGNYAIGLEWADGHNTGIYPYELLYSLGSAGS